jgi:hypothetical protein
VRELCGSTLPFAVLPFLTFLFYNILLLLSSQQRLVVILVVSRVSMAIFLEAWCLV